MHHTIVTEHYNCSSTRVPGYPGNVFIVVRKTMNTLLACCGPIEPPNKVSRIEPKTFMANERTFLNWLSMSVTLGSIASALVAFGRSSDNQSGSVQVMASVLVITAIFFCIYASKAFILR